MSTHKHTHHQECKCKVLHVDYAPKVPNADCPKILNTDPMSNMKYAGL